MEEKPEQAVTLILSFLKGEDIGASAELQFVNVGKSSSPMSSGATLTALHAAISRSVAELCYGFDDGCRNRRPVSGSCDG